MTENSQIGKKIKNKKFLYWSRNKKYKLEEHRGLWFLGRMMGLFVILCLFVMLLKKVETVFNNIEFIQLFVGLMENDPLNSLDMLFTQVQVSFIVISLTGILSSSTKPIYWTDKMELSLVKPMLFSFAAFTSYIFACLLCSVVSFTFCSEYVSIGFWSSIIIMALLTYRMVDVYFGGAKIKEEAAWYFEWMKINSTEQYEEAKQQMITVMTKNMAENDYSTFFENFDFLCEMKEYDVISKMIAITKNYNLMLFEIILDEFLYGRKYIEERRIEEVKEAFDSPCNLTKQQWNMEYLTLKGKIEDILGGKR